MLRAGTIIFGILTIIILALIAGIKLEQNFGPPRIEYRDKEVIVEKVVTKTVEVEKKQAAVMVEPVGKTIKTRTVVAVNHLGEWFASGGSAYYENESKELAVRALTKTDYGLVYFVEAEIPLPELEKPKQSETIKGVVK